MTNLCYKILELLVHSMGYGYGVHQGCYLDVALTHPGDSYILLEYDLLLLLYLRVLIHVLLPVSADCLYHPGLILLVRVCLSLIFDSDSIVVSRK